MTPGADGLPPLGLGTFGRTGAAGLEALRTAIEVGYRHFDTAQTYDTEPVVGAAIRRSGHPRDAFFVTTKVADVHLADDTFLPSLRTSLDRLGVDQVDLTLIHWPSPGNRVPLESYLARLVEARTLGLTRRIGVSNFPCALLDRAVACVGPGQLATNQVELHPFLQNRTLRACCARHGIVVTAYMPLAKGRVLQDPVLRRIGTEVDASPATVALAWLLQQGIVAIPASSRRAHLEANLAARDLRLSPAHMAAIDALDRGQRLVDPQKAPVWD
jgi:2,5-diketo-D-gluconate reductase B